ncbi:cupin domain-containing protein [Microbacterium trichothecenolyticum]|uniref:Cupin domain-containing protein n=1 Tax=Microbacterium ureisolvens TaxID=2781186 RepID=A0ABS7HWS4_9MICO|nr:MULTISPECIES: cupin domain-containing protein [Microbacterium]MBW9109007.1 cupin domain-containing protein [Microbacterium ureisolvens]MBW9119869.1 cupin domain-containing protein [Microbacterium trichothecenolyticum]
MTTAIPDIVHADDTRVGTGTLRRFIGAEHGAGVSYFFVDNEPGQGPDIHRHPYPETWVLLEGEARITIDGETLHAVAGDTATAPAGAWHGFKNCGAGRLRVLCIHASDRIIQEWQDAPGVLDIPSTGN